MSVSSILVVAAANANAAASTSLASAILAAWSAATAFWMALGAGIWRLFFEPRLKEMKASLATERTRFDTEMAAERKRCDHEMETLRNRVRDLELLLLLHGPQALRQHMQAALSEKEMEIREVREKQDKP